RADVGRDEAPEDAVGRVEGEVLGQPAGPVVVEPELLPVVADGAGVPPPLDRDGVLLDQAERRDGGGRAEHGPRERPQLLTAAATRPRPPPRRARRRGRARSPPPPLTASPRGTRRRAPDAGRRRGRTGTASPASRHGPGRGARRRVGRPRARRPSAGSRGRPG